MTKIGILVGSLRKESYNMVIAKKLVELMPEGYEAEILEIGQLPMYNQDYDMDEPAEYADFRAKLEEFDAFIFQSPEYNRSMPAVIKNAIDIGSRPWGKNRWGGKPVAVFTASLGGPGGFGANHDLRRVAAVLNMPLLNQPEVYMGGVHELIKDGEIVEGTVDFLKTVVEAYINHIDLYVK